MTDFEHAVAAVIFSEDEVQARVEELAEEIERYYGDDLPLLVGVLNGAVIFMADLARYISGHVRFEFMAVSSYGDDMVSSGAVKILKDLDSNIAGCRVLIVEDIVDSGTTLTYLLRMLHERDPKEVRVVSLLRKPLARESGPEPDWVGFDIDDVFVVGYGLDAAGRFRNLPYIAALQGD